jgi:hypothetical protein
MRMETNPDSVSSHTPPHFLSGQDAGITAQSNLPAINTYEIWRGYEATVLRIGQQAANRVASERGDTHR